MRIELKKIYSLEYGKPNIPEEPDCCAILMHADIGTMGHEGADYFTFTVITPKFLEKWPETRWGRSYLLMPEFSWPEVERMVSGLVSAISADSWENAANQLCKYMEWEFENYLPYTEQPLTMR
ncbi:hypothetical protein LPB260_25820 [Pseudomonas sp. LPB0260]|uniref:Imm8 family immunity protein n=1 Tax=Pseudomonas sp. LPB0260 TaxID=2614442 RepID=UPI0015C1C63B|nr:Imm8 family immunity protein [Pseudomonas sp. LPB0260]QLC74118.1 hypothetical protein LPB260_10870 [Pseudomonas sp. LPB0260]QLC76889.1 hypothetical protein LPB260_25820 [Pseudomonas sp. LPB0260]